MIYSSAYCNISADDGIATLRLHFPGTPVNAWNVERLREFDRALQAVLQNPAHEILVIRSGLPAGFSAGFTPEALNGLDDSLASPFAQAGQRIFNQLAESPIVSIAHIEGPCLGPGFDLALACDYRIAQADIHSAIGFGDAPTCWGGRSRLKLMLGERAATRIIDGNTIVAREAVKLGLLHDAFSSRRNKIELRTVLDGLQTLLRKPKPLSANRFAVELARERTLFRNALRDYLPPLPQETMETETTALPAAVALLGTSAMLQHLAQEFALRGVPVCWLGEPCTAFSFESDLQSGRITPLEAKHAEAKIVYRQLDDDFSNIDLLFTDGTFSPSHIEKELPPRCIVCVPCSDLPKSLQLAARPQRIAAYEKQTTQSLTLHGHQCILPGTIPSTIHWLQSLGISIVEGEAIEIQSPMLTFS